MFSFARNLPSVVNKPLISGVKRNSLLCINAASLQQSRSLSFEFKSSQNWKQNDGGNFGRGDFQDRGYGQNKFSRGNSQKSTLPPPPDWTKKQLPPITRLSYEEHHQVASADTKETIKWRADNEIGINASNRSVLNPIMELEHAWHPELVSGLKSLGIAKPLAIQSQTWPLLLRGDNVIGVAQTGSGKTLSFLLPILRHVAAQGPEQNHCVVVAPTRELAVQIHEECKKVIRGFGRINSAVVYGGAEKGPQARELRRRPEIIIGTPGRLMDFASMGLINFNTMSSVVLDEADRLLDMGFEQDIRQILQHVRPERQIVMFTATWPRKIHELSQDFIHSPSYVRIGSRTDELVAASTIKQIVHLCSPLDKLENMEQILTQLSDYAEQHGHPYRVLIFCNTKMMVDNVEDHLRRKMPNFRASGFHGDKTQSQREQTLYNFKRGNTKILIASDAASRGLDVSDVLCVINYDMPRDIESYVHRIGRTGRAGKLGTSITFFTPQDSGLKNDLMQVLKKSSQPIPEGLRYA